MLRVVWGKCGIGHYARLRHDPEMYFATRLVLFLKLDEGTVIEARARTNSALLNSGPTVSRPGSFGHTMCRAVICTSMGRRQTW